MSVSVLLDNLLKALKSFFVCLCLSYNLKTPDSLNSMHTSELECVFDFGNSTSQPYACVMREGDREGRGSCSLPLALSTAFLVITIEILENDLNLLGIPAELRPPPPPLMLDKLLIHKIISSVPPSVSN